MGQSLITHYSSLWAERIDLFKMKIASLAIIAVLLACPTICAQKQGGHMMYGELKSSESTLDPVTFSNTMALRLVELIFDGLLSFDPNGNPVWKLTKGEPEIVGQEIYIFKLRPNVRWHDGEPFSAYDVLFTYIAMKKAGRKNVAESVDFIRDVIVEDDLTVKFFLKGLVRNPLGKLAFKVVPYHCFVTDINGINSENPECCVRKDSSFTLKPIGTGPYKFREITDEKVVLDVNEDYFSERANINEITISPATMELMLVYGLTQKWLHLVVDLNSAYRKDIKAASARNPEEEPWIHEYSSLSYYFFALNNNNRFLKDKEVRQAITYATNREEWINNIELGAAALVSGPFPPDSEFLNPNVKPYEYDPDKAKRLLRSVGFSDTDGDGYLDRDGDKLSLTLKVHTDSEKHANVCKSFEHALRDIGVEVKWQVVMDKERWEQEILFQHDFDVVFGGWAYSRSASLKPFFHSTQSVPGGNNFISYNNEIVDICLDLAENQPDPEVSKSAYRELHKILADECPYVFLWSPKRMAAGRQSLHTYGKVDPYSFFTYITDWYLESK